jgi:hypothetical protein
MIAALKPRVTTTKNITERQYIRLFTIYPPFIYLLIC